MIPKDTKESEMPTMKLYELSRGSKFRLVSKDPVTPPASKELEYGDTLILKNIDGMYSFCLTQEGEIVHPAAFSDVEVVG